MTTRTEKHRCQGCGYLTTVVVQHPSELGEYTVQYCLGCEDLRDLRDIDVEDHEQYKLKEAV